jgi:hypothetical protein
VSLSSYAYVPMLDVALVSATTQSPSVEIQYAIYPLISTNPHRVVNMRQETASVP